VTEPTGEALDLGSNKLHNIIFLLGVWCLFGVATFKKALNMALRYTTLTADKADYIALFSTFQNALKRQSWNRPS
jgi:hypothetical protein